MSAKTIESTLQRPAVAGETTAKAKTNLDRKTMRQPIMKNATQRSILRWIHLVFSIPILGYIYSPFDKIPQYAPATRYVFVPVLVLAGLWMWKGHLLRRLISKRAT